jgi:hypothetical protein
MGIKGFLIDCDLPNVFEIAPCESKPHVTGTAFMMLSIGQDFALDRVS